MTNIIQCVVDEAGMCNEPETLTPLVATEPEKVVLIGDHKQLRQVHVLFMSNREDSPTKTH